MPGTRTLTIIKPDAFGAGKAGKIIAHLEQQGFKIVASRVLHMNDTEAGAFYEVHRERPFYNDLVSYMSKGPIVAMILEKDNAVEDFRKLIGATNPAQADEGTIRKLYATSIGENAVHGSDSDENAKVEGDFFFNGLERF